MRPRLRPSPLSPPRRRPPRPRGSAEPGPAGRRAAGRRRRRRGRPPHLNCRRPSPPGAPSRRREPAERVVRVTAESLTRLMGLAGESLVQTRRLRPFVDSLLAARRAADRRCWRRSSGWRTACRGVRSAPTGRRAELLAKAEAAGRATAWKGWARRSRRSRTSRAAARTSPAGCTTRCSPAGCGPLADGIRGFPRLVRDVARQLGKQVGFEVVGETTGVDRDILDKLEAPLNHLIRNALDHGDRDARRARRPRASRRPGRSGWRPATARGCSRSSSSDDGRGIDLERLRAKVVEQGPGHAPRWPAG